MNIALVGNQNSGKTTLFNILTGSNQHVGNFPGVTVEKKTGTVTGREGLTIIDLPGVYSLSPYSADEKITSHFLLRHKPDAVINIIDATNIERSLYLTLQLIEMRIPMVLALNMMDEVQANRWRIDVGALEEGLGIPAVSVSALKKRGIAELLNIAEESASKKTLPQRIDFCAGVVHRTIHAVTHLIEDHAASQSIPARFAATRLVSGDDMMASQLSLTENEIDAIEHAVAEMETEYGMDRESALADMRYKFIEGLVSDCVVKSGESREYIRSAGIDGILTHKFFAIPIFICVMLAIFAVTFGLVGNRLSGMFEFFINALSGAAGGALDAYGLNPVAQSLIIDGVFSGVGSVLGFLPIIVVLFFFLSIIEDSGYMARLAFVMDKPLRKIGLSGRSVVPMLMGFGCTVPAVLSARAINGERNKKMTILLTPFMSCGAKLPIYAMFSAAFFKRPAFVMAGLYLAGIFFSILTGIVMNKFLMKPAPVPFILELPNYRFPSIKSVLILMWIKAKDFIKRAFTIILAATVIIWFLQSFDSRLNFIADGADSILAAAGRFLSVIFKPLGFSDWRAATALFAGFSAKEAVIGTLAVLTGASPSELGNNLSAYFTPLSAMSFLIFVLLYTPCVAAVSVIRREYGSVKGLLFSVAYQTFFAWCAAAVFYQIGSLLTQTAR